MGSELSPPHLEVEVIRRHSWNTFCFDCEDSAGGPQVPRGAEGGFPGGASWD